MPTFSQDVIELLLLVAAMRAGRHRLAKGLLGDTLLKFYAYFPRRKKEENCFFTDERMARGGEVEGEGGKGGPAMLNQRLALKITQMNSAS